MILSGSALNIMDHSCSGHSSPITGAGISEEIPGVAVINYITLPGVCQSKINKKFTEIAKEAGNPKISRQDPDGLSPHREPETGSETALK